MSILYAVPKAKDYNWGVGNRLHNVVEKASIVKWPKPEVIDFHLALGYGPTPTLISLKIINSLLESFQNYFNVLIHEFRKKNSLFELTHAHMLLSKHAHVNIHTHMCTCTHTYNMHNTHIDAHTHTHTHIHTHTRTYIHTHTHTYTHTFIIKFLSKQFL